MFTAAAASSAGDVEEGGGPANPAPSSRDMSGTAPGASQPSLGQLMASRRSVNPSGGHPSSARSVGIISSAGSQVNFFVVESLPLNCFHSSHEQLQSYVPPAMDLLSTAVFVAHAGMTWLPICMMAVGGRSRHTVLHWKSARGLSVGFPAWAKAVAVGSDSAIVCLRPSSCPRQGVLPGG